MKLDQKEILRYLGYKKKDTPDEAVLALMGSVVQELLEVSDPRSVWRVFSIEAVTETAVDLGFIKIESRNLAKNLKGCSQAVFLAATLGSRVEMLLQKYSRLQVSRAMVLQASATEAIEKYCDTCEQEILQSLGEGYYLRPRFSPGYGDFSLDYRKKLLQALDASKRIGITLTDSFLMMPSKSVTAVIGISQEKTDCIRQGCELCEKTDCSYRRG